MLLNLIIIVYINNSLILSNPKLQIRVLLESEY